MKPSELHYPWTLFICHIAMYKALSYPVELQGTRYLRSHWAGNLSRFRLSQWPCSRLIAQSEQQKNKAPRVSLPTWCIEASCEK